MEHILELFTNINENNNLYIVIKTLPYIEYHNHQPKKKRKITVYLIPRKI